MKRSILVFFGIVVAQLLGCGEQGESGSTMVEMPKFADDKLMAGRSTWMRTCRACHLLGVEGAPAITDYAQWQARLPKGKEVLAQRVISGIRGDDGKYRMPPRGGNERLTDEQIRRALDYKIAAIDALNQSAE